MKLTEAIVFPVAIDDDYQERLEVLEYLAQQFRSDVILLTVLSQDINDEQAINKLTEAIKADLQKIASRLSEKQIKSKIVVRSGKPASTISKVAEQYSAGLILAEARNCEKSGRYQLGTVANRLMHLSGKPVMVTRLHETAGFGNILCPVDFSKPSVLALENAVLLAKVLKAKLRVLAVEETIDYKKAEEYSAKDKKKLTALHTRLDKFVKDFDITGLDLSLSVQGGEPHKAILKSIDDNGDNLLIMGTTGKTGIKRILMGSVTEKVTREVPCSFITTKSEDMISVEISEDVSEFAEHYRIAENLFEGALYDEALLQYNICLEINSMHVPSLFKLSKIYKLKGNEEKSKSCNALAISILDKMWDKKIEFEIRKHYS